jgi:hypothetical protein
MENTGGIAQIPVNSISLDYKALEIAGNTGNTLTAVIVPANASDQRVTWESSNENVATVVGTGLTVTVRAGTTFGNATITVTTEDGEYSDFCSVTVSPVSVTGVSLTSNAFDLYTGTRQSLSARITPSNATNKAVIWASTDPGVATVTGTGLEVTINALSVGTATITVTTAEGSFSDTCTVSVTESQIPNLIIKNQAVSPGGGTTPDTADDEIFIALTGNNIDGWSWTGTAEVTYAESTSIGSGGVGNTTMVYLDTPMKGSYTMTAKLKITGSSATPNVHGLIFAELAGPGDAGASGYKNLVGIRHLSNNGVRGYYLSSSEALATGSPNTSLTVGTEYTYEIKWDGSTYSWKAGSSNGSVGLSSMGAVFSGRAAGYHPGIIVLKQTIVISELRLTLD